MPLSGNPADGDGEIVRELFSSVKTITIGGGYHNRLKDFLSLLSAFPNMAILRLTNLLYNEDDDGGGGAQFPKPLPGSGLRTLDIVHDNRGADHLTSSQYEELVQTWLVPLADVLEPGLRFRWDDLGSDDVETFPRFMQALAPVLVSLSNGAVAMGTLYSIVVDALPISILGDFGITDCTELRTIALGPLCRPFRSKSPKKDADAWVPQLLSNIRSTKLTTVTQKFAYESVVDFRAPNFVKLSQVLLHPPLSNAKVILSFPGSPHEDGDFHFFSSASMAIKFHDVCQRGILKTIFH